MFMPTAVLRRYFSYFFNLLKFYLKRRCLFQAADLSKPIDKKLYKGTNPSCHDFNSTNATNDGAPLLVGFTTGQIQLVQAGRREPGKLYNEEVSNYINAGDCKSIFFILIKLPAIN